MLYSSHLTFILEMQKVDPATPAKAPALKEEAVTPSPAGPVKAVNNGNSTEQNNTPNNPSNNSFRGKRGGRGGRGGPAGMGRGGNHQGEGGNQHGGGVNHQSGGGRGGRGGRGGGQNGNINRFPQKNNGPNQERKWDGENSHNNYINGAPKQSEVIWMLHAMCQILII